MGKVSIALRGWRFDEDDVFAEDGKLKPFEEMSDDAAERIARLPELVGSPCDACWLAHGEDDVEAPNPVRVVYGEPMAEVGLCDDHEDDFVYWYREAGGRDHRGEPEFADAFHEWFLDSGRAPDWFAGVEHVDTDPEELPELPDERRGVLDMHVPDEEKERIDLMAGEVLTGAEADREEETEEEAPAPGLDGEDDPDVDLSRDYPG